MEAQGVVGSADVLSEDDQSAVVECEEDPPTWQSVVSRDVLANLKPREIERQEVINGKGSAFIPSQETGQVTHFNSSDAVLV